MDELKRVGVLGHPKRPQTVPVATHITQTLQAHGIETWCETVWEEDDVIKAIETSDLVVAIGGDGAMLRAARVCAPFGVPVLGLNMGRLGFLTEVASPEDWERDLHKLLNHNWWVEERMLIRAQIYREKQLITEGIALNDVVTSGTSAGTVIQVDAYIDRHWATTYNCDALITATPTGSTAYALAVGGPILPPDLSNILVIPSASHLSMDRPIVLSEGSQVGVRPSHDNRAEILVTIDGIQLANLQAHDTMIIKACEFKSRFVRMRERNYFYRSLLDRLEPRVNRTAPDDMKTLTDIEDMG